MNITAIDTAGSITIDCQTCGNEVTTPAHLCTIVDANVLAIPCATHGCARVTFVPRQRPDDPPEVWAWDHSRAMNVAFAVALRKGATVNPELPPATKAKLNAEKAGSPKRRFPREEWKDFAPGERIKSVAEEEKEKEESAASIPPIP